MHWFWRSLITCAIAVALSWMFYTGPLFGVPASKRDIKGFFMVMLFFVPASVATLLINALITKYLKPLSLMDSETRCRKCRYILRGITEPRCSECGERM